MRKADRLFQVVNLIRAHQPITAHKLAERLYVSSRTVYRYIDDLSLSGIPIYGEPGVGYSLHKDFELAPLSLNPKEITTLVLGLEMLTTSVGGKTKSIAQALISKIEASNPDVMKTPKEKRFFSMLSSPECGLPNTWWALTESINNSTPVKIDYCSLDGKYTQRVVFPLGMFYWGGKWTIGTWCTIRHAYRDFRVDRIRDVELLAPSTQLAYSGSLSEYMQHQLSTSSKNISAPTDSTLSVGDMHSDASTIS
jgi:predicted DNA-binding transcriptional regulator YafY